MSTLSASYRRTRWFDLLASILLVTATLIAASQVIATEWVENLQLLWVVVLIGSALGTALGYSRFSPNLVVFLAFLYGLFIIPWLIGLTVDIGIPWLDRLAGMLEILGQTFQQLVDGENVTSPLLFLILMSVLTWTLSVYATYTLTRYGLPWRAAIPGGVTMLVIATYSVRDSTNTLLLGAYIFVALLLVARVSYLNRHIEWRGERTILPGDIGFNMARAIVFFALIVVLLAWSAPALGAAMPSFENTWKEVTKPLDGFRQRMSKVFAPVESSIGLINVKAIQDYYGDELPLGRGNWLTDELILRVDAPELPTDVPRYYWRARSYDHYEDGGWTSTPIQSETYSPDRFNLEQPEFMARWDTRVDITPQRRLSLIFTPNQPYWVSHPVEVQLSDNPDGTADVVAMRATPPLLVGDEYSVAASISNATIADMRQAGTDYPDWVSERYLQVPGSVTDRTIELAQQIAEGKDNPYDIVEAVTLYLRDNIQYKEFLEELPRNQDPIDWLLFDKREGFCNYYASAEVILLRSLGIPARVTVGYSEGELAFNQNFTPSSRANLESGLGAVDDDSSFINSYRVYQRNAHAWPEVYFPGFGWVEFEPTVNQEPIMRPLGVLPPEPDQNDESPFPEDELAEEDLGFGPDDPIPDDEVEQFDDQSSSSSASIATLIDWRTAASLAVLVLVLVIWRVRPMRNLPPMPILLESGLLRMGIKPPAFLHRWAVRASLPPVASAYNELNRALVRLGEPPSPAATPTERALGLAYLLPDVKDQAEIVVDEYHDLTYSADPGDLVNAFRASRVIRRLSYRAWLGKYTSLFDRRTPG
jgi:transglutaminase-like putative cysteine protease